MVALNIIVYTRLLGSIMMINIYWFGKYFEVATIHGLMNVGDGVLKCKRINEARIELNMQTIGKVER
jgi:hypothetical protein